MNLLELPSFSIRDHLERNDEMPSFAIHRKLQIIWRSRKKAFVHKSSCLALFKVFQPWKIIRIYSNYTFELNECEPVSKYLWPWSYLMVSVFTTMTFSNCNAFMSPLVSFSHSTDPGWLFLVARASLQFLDVDFDKLCIR